MDLVTTARLWWKKYSTYFFVILGALPSINLYVPFTQAFLTPAQFAALSAVVGILGVVATQIKQPALAVQAAELKAEDLADDAKDKE